jgi:LysM repeat protein
MKSKISHDSKQSVKKLSSHFAAATISASFLLIASSCVNNKGQGTAADYGPFDANGNYIEEWADNPKYSNSRSRPPAPSDVDTGMVAAHETPLPTAMPTASLRTTPPSRPPSASTMPKVSTASRTSTSAKPKTTVVKTTTKPKVTATKPKPKAPTTTRVVVKKGDTLYELALRHKTSVSAIQKANGLRSSVLQIGKSLVIPK